MKKYGVYLSGDVARIYRFGKKVGQVSLKFFPKEALYELLRDGNQPSDPDYLALEDLEGEEFEKEWIRQFTGS